MVDVDLLFQRTVSGGGFSIYPQGDFRPDATSWAVLALEAMGYFPRELESHRRALERCQLADGRVPLFRSQPDAVWPTALSILAWGGRAEFSAQRDRAVEFLLKCRGHTEHDPDRTFFGHDRSLAGWPWTLGTNSWVEPTSLAVLALHSCAFQEDPRCVEGVRLLTDRMLPSGGWNYGNTTVFGMPLRPMLSTSGTALCALAGLVEQQQIQLSLDYVAAQAHTTRAPLSLAWGTLALSAWSLPVDALRERLERILSESSSLESLSTEELALMILALTCSDILNRGHFAEEAAN